MPKAIILFQCGISLLALSSCLANSSPAPVQVAATAQPTATVSPVPPPTDTPLPPTPTLTPIPTAIPTSIVMPTSTPAPGSGQMGVLLQGTQITGWLPVSPARDRGLRIGDSIRTIDGIIMISDQSITDYIASKRSGDTIIINVQGNGTQNSISFNAEALGAITWAINTCYYSDVPCQTGMVVTLESTSLINGKLRHSDVIFSINGVPLVNGQQADDLVRSLPAGKNANFQVFSSLRAISIPVILAPRL